MLANLLSYRSCTSARILAPSQRKLAHLFCPVSRNVELYAQSQDDRRRALDNVAWGLTYHEPTANANRQHGSASEQYSDLDAIIVLAGGQTGPDSIPMWVERRLDTALSLQRLQSRTCPIVSLGTSAQPHSGYIYAIVPISETINNHLCFVAYVRDVRKTLL